MLLDVAKPKELREYHELFEKSKGAATVFAMRIIKKHWDKHFKGIEIKEELPQEANQVEEEDTYNGIRINYWKTRN